MSLLSSGSARAGTVLRNTEVSRSSSPSRCRATGLALGSGPAAMVAGKVLSWTGFLPDRDALDRVGIDPGVVAPMRVVRPERRRARLGLARPRDPCLPVGIGYRERFRHELVDLGECPVLEPALFALIDRLRQVARDLIPPGGSAEVTLTRTDSDRSAYRGSGAAGSRHM